MSKRKGRETYYTIQHVLSGYYIAPFSTNSVKHEVMEEDRALRCSSIDEAKDVLRKHTDHYGTPMYTYSIIEYEYIYI